MTWKFLETRFYKGVHYLRDCGTKGCISIPTPRHNSPTIVGYVPIAFPFWSLSIVDEGHKPKAIRDVIVGQSPLGIYISPMTQLKEESEHSTLRKFRGTKTNLKQEHSKTKHITLFSRCDHLARNFLKWDQLWCVVSGIVFSTNNIGYPKVDYGVALVGYQDVILR